MTTENKTKQNKKKNTKKNKKKKTKNKKQKQNKTKRPNKHKTGHIPYVLLYSIFPPGDDVLLSRLL